MLMLCSTVQEMKQFISPSFRRWYIILSVVLIGSTRIQAYRVKPFHLLQSLVISDVESTAGCSESINMLFSSLINNTVHRLLKFCRTTCKGKRAYLQIQQSKGKAVPLQAWTGPEGSQEVKFPRLRDDGTRMVVGCQPYAPAVFNPRKYSWYSFLLEAESTPGP